MINLLLGDCLEKLKELEDNSVDSVVTDPPYGLGEVKDIAGLLSEWLAGNSGLEHTSGVGFMLSKWDSCVPPPAVWKEVYRVLKPGGHMVVFAGPRTQDLMGMSIRIAGFECREAVCWVFGTGMPKGMNIEKAIEKKYGKEATKNGSFKGLNTGLKPAHEPVLMFRKPLSENSTLDNVVKHGTGGINVDDCRVPGAERPLMGLDPTKRTKSQIYNGRNDGSLMCGSKVVGTTNLGRWPTNIVFSHLPECVCIGVKEVKNTSGGVSGNEPSHTGDENTVCYGEYNRVSFDKYGDENGLELIEEWECVEGCPIKELNEQSSEASRYFNTFESEDINPVAIFRKPLDGTIVDNVVKYGTGGINIDECRLATNENISNHSRGSASAKSKGIYGDSKAQQTHKTEGQELGRYPPNFVLQHKDECENECVEGCPIKEINNQGELAGSHSAGSGRERIVESKYEASSYHASINRQMNRYEDEGNDKVSRFFYCAKAPKKERSCDLYWHRTKSGVKNVTKEEWEQLPQDERAYGNIHTTVKPLKVMDWLVKMVTPKNGVVLDPFTGSGSTGVAAINNNYNFIGIEKDPNYYLIAKTRLNVLN